MCSGIFFENFRQKQQQQQKLAMNILTHNHIEQKIFFF
jgi:hypothetical protein